MSVYFFLHIGITDTNTTSPLIVLLEDLSNTGKSTEATEVRYHKTRYRFNPEGNSMFFLPESGCFVIYRRDGQRITKRTDSPCLLYTILYF